MSNTILLAALLVGTSVTPAIAGGPVAAADGGATVIVRYDDLNLDRRGDRAQLRRRIRAAIEAICGSYATSFSFQEEEIARCQRGARANTDLQLARLPQRGRSRGVGTEILAPTQAELEGRPHSSRASN